MGELGVFVLVAWQGSCGFGAVSDSPAAQVQPQGDET